MRTGILKYALAIILAHTPMCSFGQKQVQLCKMDKPPVLDGVLEENCWNLPDSATGFIQMEPFKGSEASERTVVYAGYDDLNLYFGIKCYEPDQSAIVANIRTRDMLTKNDDIVLVLLDTYFDKRTSLGFFVNPAGTQVDMKVVDDGRSLDLNWDTEWDAAAGRSALGWSVEIIIPFNSISYNRRLETWGINFGRIIRKNSETVYWSRELNNDFRVSQGGLLTGVTVPGTKHLFDITPYATIRYENSDLSGNYQRILPEAGIDLAYQYASNIKINGTFNPDFATVEGDQEQINLTRWELSFPEKRIFFLEGNELFDTRIKTFYSRRIGDIEYGAKATGKAGGFNFYVMEARSRRDTVNALPAANYSVIRLKKDVLESSTIGLSWVDKRGEGGITNSISLDYVLNLGESWKLTGQFVGGEFEDLKNSSAYFVRIANESNVYHYHIRYSYTGDRFQDDLNETGFIRDDDMKELDSDITYRWWYKNEVIKYLSLGTYNNIFWSTTGELRSWYLTEKARLYLQNRLSFDFSYNNEFKLYDKKYYNHKYIAEVGYNTDEWSSAFINYSWGRNYDRDFYLITGSLKIRPVKRLSLSYSFNKLKFSPDVDQNSTLVNILTLDYNFTRDLWIRLLAQNNAHEERFYYYGLFGWRFKPPFGALYLIYTSDKYSLPFADRELRSDILYLKLSYNFGIPSGRKSRN